MSVPFASNFLRNLHNNIQQNLYTSTHSKPDSAEQCMNIHIFFLAGYYWIQTIPSLCLCRLLYGNSGRSLVYFTHGAKITVRGSHTRDPYEKTYDSSISKQFTRIESFLEHKARFQNCMPRVVAPVISTQMREISLMSFEVQRKHLNIDFLPTAQ